MTAPAVTIFMCTRNRCGQLAHTLDSLRACRIPADLPAELIIVDNGSTDQTPALLAAHRPDNMTLRILHEPRKGKAKAVNRAVAAARGQILVQVDDDVFVPPDWIPRIVDPILAGRAELVAGAVDIAPQLQRPWITARIASWLASTVDIDPQRPDRAVGANMAFHRRVLDHVPRFDENLGPGALGFHEETLFVRQAMNAGHRLVTAFDVRVEHHFTLGRLTYRSLVKTAWKMGRCDAYVDYHWHHRTGRAYVRRAKAILRRTGPIAVEALRDRRSDEGCPEPLLLLIQEVTYLHYIATFWKTSPVYDPQGLRRRF